MKKSVLQLTYESSLTNLCEVNSSFDTGILRIAYAGQNRNGSYISKDAFERSMKTLYNVPVVMNYDRDADTIGGHDVDVVMNDDGDINIVNLTTPVGVIPESSRIFWEPVTEEDGQVREYLCAEALIWKRQEGYQKLKEDGITAQSMEITIQEGDRQDDGYYHIDKFEFTALALIGVEPCFESASIKMFQQKNFALQLEEMKKDLKEYFSTIATSNEDNNTNSQNYSEGGEPGLEDKKDFEQLKEPVIGADEGATDEVVVDEPQVDEGNTDGDVTNTENAGTDGQDESGDVEETGADSQDDPDDGADTDDDGDPDDGEPDGEEADGYSLNSQLLEQLDVALEAEMVDHEWGRSPRYIMTDFDADVCEVYCWDSADWNLYGFKYSLDGDNVVIDWDSKTRKKIAIVDFDEGESASESSPIFSAMETVVNFATELSEKYQTQSTAVEAMRDELDTLRKFKSDVEDEAAIAEREEIFAQFEDLNGIEAFEELRDNCTGMDVETLEEKCYALRGKHAKQNFGYAPKSIRRKVTTSEDDNADEPYGGLFRIYGITKNK